MKINSKWDARFMRVAKEVSTWSKDTSTKIGAVIVSDARHILATGYNGFPKGIADTEERLNDREQKYPLVVHAEMNALMGALYNGVLVKGSTIYVYGLPMCSGCAKCVISAGISRVVVCYDITKQNNWNDDIEKYAKPMLLEAGISTSWMNPLKNENLMG
jgi:dCMP deaminase